MSDKPSKLKIAGREFTSRLLVGTGKFASNELMRDALVASGTEIVTVALRRADLSGKHDPFANILDFIDPKQFLLLPNTSGARTAEEAEAAEKARDWRRAATLWDQLRRAQPEEPLYWIKTGEACLEAGKALQTAKKAVSNLSQETEGLGRLFIERHRQ